MTGLGSRQFFVSRDVVTLERENAIAKALISSGIELASKFPAQGGGRFKHAVLFFLKRNAG